jgi:hypothetical protein
MSKAILLGTLALAAGVAQADPLLGLYAGAGVTNNSVDYLGHGFDIKDGRTGWKGFVGLRPLGSPVGIEVQYLDLGSRNYVLFNGLSPENETARARAVSFDAVGYIPLPLPFLSMTAKVGAAHWDANVPVEVFVPPDEPVETHYHATQLTWGVGAQAHFGVVGVRLEYERLNVLSSDARVVSLSALFTFF